LLCQWFYIDIYFNGVGIIENDKSAVSKKENAA